MQGSGTVNLILLRGSLALYERNRVSEQLRGQEPARSGSTYGLQLLEEPIASLNVRRLETPCEFYVVVYISVDTLKAVVTNLHEPLA